MKKLNILLANTTLSFLGGSETWTMTLALELKNQGHNVRLFSPELGIISDKLAKEGLKSFNEMKTSDKPRPFSFILEEAIVHEYDVIIANHNHVVKYLREVFPRTPIISTIHGIIHEAEGQMAPEHPALDSGVNQFVAVSEEVQELLKTRYNIDSKIVRNFFDLKKFDMKEPNATPKQFFVNTNYADGNSDEIQVIREVAKHFEAKLTAVGMNFSPTLDIKKALEDSDVVFGMGRSVLEGVASGRLGIVHGRWGTGGVINESNINEIRSCNFSGRNSNGVLFTVEEMIKAIEENYNPANLTWGKTYMKQNHNVILGADEYIRMARELTGVEINEAPVDTRRPFKLAKT